MKENTDPTKVWAQTWKMAGQALESIKRQELQALAGSNYLDEWDGMLQWACEHATERSTTGLVEQQRIFARLRSVT